jgi:hypothetical protein
MSIIAPDVVAEGRGFSVGFCAVGLAVGLLVWLTGWRAHRFWIVLAATIAAGVAGLSRGAEFRVQPLVAGLLLAVAAGLLALALVRVVAFAAGGLAACLAAKALPAGPWQQPLVCFLAGGLAGLLLFRIWTMMLTGFAGAVIIGYCGLWLADRLGQADAVAVANQQQPLLNGACLAGGLAGLGVQFLLERRRLRRLKREKEYQQAERNWRRGREQRGWFGWGRPPYRRAG